MEYFHQKEISHVNVSNHMARIRAGIPPFKDQRVPLFIKSLKLNVPLLLKTQITITIQMLHQILQACNTLEAPLLFKSLYLFTFFSFLRLSNMFPHAVKQFDATRHLAREDLIFSSSFCIIIIIKW